MPAAGSGSSSAIARWTPAETSIVFAFASFAIVSVTAGTPLTRLMVVVFFVVSSTVATSRRYTAPWGVWEMMIAPRRAGSSHQATQAHVRVPARRRRGNRLETRYARLKRLLHGVESQAAPLQLREVDFDLNLALGPARDLDRANARNRLETLLHDVYRRPLQLDQRLWARKSDVDDGEGAGLELNDGGRFCLGGQLAADRVR